MTQSIIVRRLSGAFGHLGWMRGAIGAFVGIAVSGGAAMLLTGTTAAQPFLVAPLGASAVLIFCVPASPLAQPWPVIGGNLISAAIGLAVGSILGQPWMAGSVAVGLSIAIMARVRCLHPPGGACALLFALEAAGASSWGWGHLIPLCANVAALVTAGWLYNNSTGHSWPHRPYVGRTTAPDLPYTRADIEATVRDWDEVLDVDIDDLDAFVKAVLRRAKI